MILQLLGISTTLLEISIRNSFWHINTVENISVDVKTKTNPSPYHVVLVKPDKVHTQISKLFCSSRLASLLKESCLSVWLSSLSHLWVGKFLEIWGVDSVKCGVEDGEGLYQGTRKSCPVSKTAIFCRGTDLCHLEISRR